MNKQPKYQRIILKFSGEALIGAGDSDIDFAVLHYIANEVKTVLNHGVQVGIVIGGGNFFRGAALADVNRIVGDQMGMFATLINALALRDVFEQENITVRVLSALTVHGVVETYDHNLALKYLEKGEVLIFGGGTGNPLVTTDTALSLRGIELNADLLLKATNVDGVYSANPNQNTNAKLYTHLTYTEALEKQLKVMDMGAFSLCRDHDMFLRVYNMQKAGALLRIVLGEDEGTLVENGKF
ncbi:MAG: UMP kinase [Gammaproteobacteria bacterium GWE2_37_16]|nr:MAG: UMP kinase [Gammaproteobacteria bacterium GWE2_37_16]